VASTLGKTGAGLKAAVKAFRDTVRPPPNAGRSGLNLNVGSGGYSIAGFVDVDIPSDWYDKQREGTFAAYDMRTGKLPFNDNAVDNIYCSHVIEHIEDEHVANFFADSARVLVPGGVLRIAVPDAEFIWQVSQFDNQYWDWRQGWFSSRGFNPDDYTQRDFMIREISTRKLRHLDRSFTPLHDQIGTMDFEQAMVALMEGNIFELANVGNHINYWTLEKIKALAGGAFSHIIRSKANGSVSAAMRGKDMDLKQPQMTLYVELVK
jgi:SAM-dependent methyltransferase